MFGESVKNEISILDPGAGAGVLTAALCEQLLLNSSLKKIQAVLYDTDVIPLLKKNMVFLEEYCAQKDIVFDYEIKEENFIISNAEQWENRLFKKQIEYDYIISNPPYKKIRKDAEESQIMKSIVHGQPNIYFLFMAMSAKLLKKNGEMVFITPRSFTSGAYFRQFRMWIMQNMSLERIHSFESRSKIFKIDKVLQETIITKFRKSNSSSKNLTISENDDLHFRKKTFEVKISMNIILDKKTGYSIKIPTNEPDIYLLRFMNQWKETLKSLGFEIKTGPVVDFRIKDHLTEEESDHTKPLFWPLHLKNNQINFPETQNTKNKPQYFIYSEKSSKQMIKNKDYIFIKRFTSKEEKKRIQCAIYRHEDFQYDLIGIENHLNYIKKREGDFENDELLGLFTILNSSFVDRYYRILNGNTQVNANEMNMIPLPSQENLLKIGNKAYSEKKLTTKICDEIIANIFLLDINKIAV
jgi:adenine-specific DNA-methyltransferase